MAIYKYNNKETPGYFTDFETIKPSLKRGDRIQFFNGGMTDGDILDALNYMPGLNIREDTTYEQVKKYLFNLSGYKVKIKMHTNIKDNHLEWFDYWYNTDAEITLDCRDLPEEKGTFFIGLLNRYKQYTLSVGTNELISTRCFNIIPLDESHSLRGLENRRLFVIGSYGWDSKNKIRAGYDKHSLYKYGRSQTNSIPHGEGIPDFFDGGSGWFGGVSEKHGWDDGYHITGGSNFVLTPDTVSSLPPEYMSDYQQYLDIISNGKIDMIKEQPSHSQIVLEMIIVSKFGEIDTSISHYYDGNKVIDCSSYYVSNDNKITQTDIYYYNGNKLIKI